MCPIKYHIIMKTQTKYPIIKCNKMLIRVVKELLKRKVAKSSFRYHNRIKLRIILLRIVLPNYDVRICILLLDFFIHISMFNFYIIIYDKCIVVVIDMINVYPSNYRKLYLCPIMEFVYNDKDFIY